MHSRVGNSDCPPLIRHRPHRESVITITPTPAILALLEIPLSLEESDLLPSSSMHSSDPTLPENALVSIPVIQSTVSLLQTQNDSLDGSGSIFPWRALLESVPTFLSLNFIS